MSGTGLNQGMEWLAEAMKAYMSPAAAARRSSQAKAPSGSIADLSLADIAAAAASANAAWDKRESERAKREADWAQRKKAASSTAAVSAAASSKKDSSSRAKPRAVHQSCLGA